MVLPGLSVLLGAAVVKKGTRKVNVQVCPPESNPRNRSPGTTCTDEAGNCVLIVGARYGDGVCGRMRAARLVLRYAYARVQAAKLIGGIRHPLFDGWEK
eukprot:2285497-Rhodomonas_salina.1